MKLFSLISLLTLLVVAQTKSKQREKNKNKSGLVLTESGQLCHFPFYFARIAHHSCIRRGKNGPKPWCSLTRNYDRDRSWSYCIEDHDVKDHCDDNPCEPRGVCESTLKGYQCACKEPYTGRHCRTDKCFDGKLKRYFEPKEKWLRYSPPKLEECTCHEKGIVCKITPGKECSRNPCLNKGRCMESRKSTVCSCPKGYSGILCDIHENETCFTGDGTSYRGTANATVTGTPCLHWDSDIIDQEVQMFSDKHEQRSGLGDHPYCRNPYGDIQPWCYVLKDDRMSWEHCLVPRCNQSSVTTPAPLVTQPTHQITAPNATNTNISNATASNPPGNMDIPVNGSRGLTENCGKRFKKSPALSPRIVGGLVALPASHPYIAALYIEEQFCGGSLINSCWVVTAAHCFNNRPRVSRITVVLGQSLFNVTDQHTMTFPVAKYLLHELYDDYTFQHDIALVRLQSKTEACAEFSQFVQPVCLPQNLVKTGTSAKCEVAGWGHQYEGAEDYALFLQEAFIPIIPDAQCQAADVHANRFQPGMLCAGFMEGGTDACQGDSGGPLVCEVDGRVELHGIVSWGTGCGEENKPGVYTSVSKYIDWITINMK
ncbi:coagulation factor XII [Discoglossus pictus]